jgi:hypothetical protein
VQRHSAPEMDDDRPTVAFHRPEQPGDPIESLLAGWPDPSSRLSLRHWTGIAALGAVILAAAFGLPPVVSSDGNGQAATPASSVASSAPDVRAPVPLPIVPGPPGASTAPLVPSSEDGSSSPTASAHPTMTGAAPATTAPKAATTRRTGTTSGDAPDRFPAISVQAEAPENQLSGGAQPVACAACSGGARVRYMGRVDVHLRVPASGKRTVTVVYEVSGSRNVDISVDGRAPMVVSLSGTGWESPSTTTFTVTIPAGEVSLGFYNPDGDCPDIDAVTVS